MLISLAVVCVCHVAAEPEVEGRVEDDRNGHSLCAGFPSLRGTPVPLPHVLRQISGEAVWFVCYLQLSRLIDGAGHRGWCVQSGDHILAQTAWNSLNDVYAPRFLLLLPEPGHAVSVRFGVRWGVSFFTCRRMRTDLPLRFRPEVLATSAVFLAARLLRLKLPGKARIPHGLACSFLPMDCRYGICGAVVTLLLHMCADNPPWWEVFDTTLEQV